jgi:hypothetical protein
METCFVMQVFDGGAYDRRYDETFAPAIRSGGATPVRADKILGTKPVIEKIEAALRGATIAFAEISENNPNVFIELGYALELGIPLVMVCDRSKRSSLPFDITHRPVIFYKTEAQGDFEQLSKDIESAVAAALNEAAEIIQAKASILVPTPTAQSSDKLKSRILLEILEGEMGDPDGLSFHNLRNTMARSGVSERLTSLATLALEQELLVERGSAQDYNGNEFIVHNLTDAGRSMLLAQYADIKRQEEEAQRDRAISSRPAPTFDSDLDDDVPF